MIQQVNLYQPSLSAPEPLAPHWMARALLALVLALVAATGYFALARRWSESAVGSLERQLEARQAELARLARAIEAQLGESTYAERARALEQDRASKRALLDQLANGSLDRVEGFSRELRALSAGRVEGVWLTRFAFSRGGSELVLSGHALRAEDIPLLLEQLGQTETFAGTEFREFRLSRPERGAALSFEARTRPAEPASEPAS